MTEQPTAAVQRETAVYDIYTGLRRTGFTRIGAMRVMRTVGISLGEAKRADDTFVAPLPLQQGIWQ